MRQAGRFLPEYRALRARYNFLELCRNPSAAAEVTLLPIDRLGVDAAILFADILLLVEPLGVGLEFAKGEGPVIHRPIRTGAQVERLTPIDPATTVSFVFETVRTVVRALGGRVPLIGFAGAPFTLASYAIEGGHSTSFALTKGLMYGEPQTWHRLAETLSEVVADYLRAQVEAGAQAVQLFDSWVGALDEADYRELVLPHVKRIFDALADLDVPTIHFGTGTGHLLAAQRDAGGSVIGIDWRTPLDEGWRRVGDGVAVQGNLDPTLLFAPRERLLARVDDVLRRAGSRPGHIFNLGHGILPGTPPEAVRAVTEHVHVATGERDKVAAPR
jgi:uroporphyrinogen decarboxylase